MSKSTEASTSDLTDELSKRQGVQRIVIEPHEEFKIKIGGVELTFQGPVVILVNQD